MSEERKPQLKSRLMLVAKLAIVAIVLLLVGKTLVEGVRGLGEFDWRSLRWPWLAAAGGVYLLGLAPAGLYWNLVLRKLGQHPRLGDALRAYYIGHLGKYVPGKAMVVVLRAGLIRGERVGTAVAAVSVFFETLTMMAVGAFIAALILAIGFREQTTLMVGAVGLMLAAGVPTIPPLFRRLVKIAGVGRADPNIHEHVRNVGGGVLAVGWACMTVSWLLLGVSLWATIRAFTPDVPLVEHMPLFVASVSMAMVAGFLSLLPGGVGVREGVLLALLVPFFESLGGSLGPKAAALLATTLLRLVWLLAELAISGVLYVGVRKTNEETSPTTADSADAT